MKGLQTKGTTKKDLILSHATGKLPVIAKLRHKTGVRVVCLCQITDTKVFGFITNGYDSVYFYVKVDNKADKTFQVCGKTYKLEDFTYITK